MYDHDVKDAKPDRPTYSDARVTDAVYDPFFGMDHPARITVNQQRFVRQELFDQAMGIADDYKANAADALDDLEEAYDVIESLNAQIDSLEVRIESAVQALRGRK